jgi:hypothetical protein
MMKNHIIIKSYMHCIYYFDNQTAGNVKIRCRLEKIDKTGNYTQLNKAVFYLSTRRLINDANRLKLKSCI